MLVWEIIYEALNESGINVYPPATKIGECKEKYLVVKQSYTTQLSNFSSEIVYYDFLLYVPQNEYHILDSFSEEVKNVINTKLYPLLMPTGEETEDYYEETIKAHMRSFLYRNVRRNKHL